MRRYLVLLLSCFLMTACSKDTPAETSAPVVIDTSSAEELHSGKLKSISAFVVEPELGATEPSGIFFVFIQSIGTYDGVLSLKLDDTSTKMFKLGDYYFIRMEVTAEESQVHLVTSDGDDLGSLDTLPHMGSGANLHDLVQEIIKTDVGYMHVTKQSGKLSFTPLTIKGEYSGQFAETDTAIYYTDEYGEQVVFLDE